MVEINRARTKIILVPRKDVGGSVCSLWKLLNKRFYIEEFNYVA